LEILGKALPLDAERLGMLLRFQTGQVREGVVTIIDDLKIQQDREDRLRINVLSRLPEEVWASDLVPLSGPMIMEVAKWVLHPELIYPVNRSAKHHVFHLREVRRRELVQKFMQKFMQKYPDEEKRNIELLNIEQLHLILQEPDEESVQELLPSMFETAKYFKEDWENTLCHVYEEKILRKDTSLLPDAADSARMTAKKFLNMIPMHGLRMLIDMQDKLEDVLYYFDIKNASFSEDGVRNLQRDILFKWMGEIFPPEIRRVSEKERLLEILNSAQQNFPMPLYIKAVGGEDTGVGLQTFDDSSTTNEEQYVKNVSETMAKTLEALDKVPPTRGG